MRHRKSGRQLGRNTHHRQALFRSLVTSLLEHERIETTEAKAKELRIVAERMISLGKEGSLHARRRAAAYLRAKRLVSKLFKDLAARFTERKGGYTRIIKTRRRVGGAALLGTMLALLATIAVFVAAGPARRVPQASSPVLPQQADAGLQGFSFAQTKGGLVDWKIQARHAQLFEAKATARLHDDVQV